MVARDIEVSGVRIETRQQCTSLWGDHAATSITAGELPDGIPVVERHDRDELDLRSVGVAFPQDLGAPVAGDTPSRENSWQLQPEDIAQIVLDLLNMNERALPSKVEIRPSKPPQK